jgi:hypothetical protein
MDVTRESPMAGSPAAALENPLFTYGQKPQYFESLLCAPVDEEDEAVKGLLPDKSGRSGGPSHLSHKGVTCDFR